AVKGAGRYRNRAGASAGGVQIGSETAVVAGMDARQADVFRRGYVESFALINVIAVVAGLNVAHGDVIVPVDDLDFLRECGRRGSVDRIRTEAVPAPLERQCEIFPAAKIGIIAIDGDGVGG